MQLVEKIIRSTATSGCSVRRRTGRSSGVFFYAHRCRRSGFFAALILLTLASPVHALKTDSDQPINIRARTVEANEKTGVTVYRGDVSMTQGSLHIQAERIDVLMRNDQLQTVRAVGQPVKLRARSDRGEDLRARALRMEYAAPTRQIDLRGNVVLERDKDVLNGAVVRYNLASQELTAEGERGGQVSAVIQPAPPNRP